MIPLSTYLKQYKVGDMVDVVANGAVQKGMPYKVYSLTPPTTPHQLTSYSPLGLPRQNRRRLQRHKVRRGRHPLPPSRQPLHREAHQRAHRARAPLALARRVLAESEGECGEEEEDEGGGHAGVSQALARAAETGEDSEREGRAEAGEC